MCLEAKTPARVEQSPGRSTTPIDLSKQYRRRDGTDPVPVKRRHPDAGNVEEYPFEALGLYYDQFGNYWSGPGPDHYADLIEIVPATKEQRSTTPLDLSKKYQLRDGTKILNLEPCTDCLEGYEFTGQHPVHGRITFDKFGNYYRLGTNTASWDLVEVVPAFDFSKSYRYRNGETPTRVFPRSEDKDLAQAVARGQLLGSADQWPVASVDGTGRIRSHQISGIEGYPGGASDYDLLEAAEARPLPEPGTRIIVHRKGQEPAAGVVEPGVFVHRRVRRVRRVRLDDGTRLVEGEILSWTLEPEPQAPERDAGQSVQGFLPLEVGKFYKNRRGSKVRILATDGQGHFPIIGLDLGLGVSSDEVERYTAEGRYTTDQNDRPWDITGPWVEPAVPLNPYPSTLDPELWAQHPEAGEAHVFKAFLNLSDIWDEVEKAGPLPEGFELWPRRGPLPVEAENSTDPEYLNVAAISGGAGSPDKWDTSGWIGNWNLVYALRIGSETHKQNFATLNHE